MPDRLVPAVCDSSPRSVTLCSASAGLSGKVQLVSAARTSVSSESLPFSTSRSAATAATGLLTDPAWNSVFVSTVPLPTAELPKPRASTMRQFSMMAMLTPGTR